MAAIAGNHTASTAAGMVDDEQTRPLVYVYAMPPAFNLYLEGDSMERNTGWWLWRALLNSTHRTLQPDKAHFFYVPVFPMVMNEHVLLDALTYLRRKWPYWNTTRGNNHLVVGAWDFGLSFVAGRPEFERLVQLSHFGWVNVTRKWQTTPDGRCPAWAGGTERMYTEAPADPNKCKSFAVTVYPQGGPHRRGIDLVIPDIMEQRFKLPGTEFVDFPVERTTRVFFSGAFTNIWRAEVH